MLQDAHQDAYRQSGMRPAGRNTAALGSRVAEGACRYLIKDRLEQTRMRWTVEGAQAMLHVRALYLNGQWEDFLEHRIGQEQTRLYSSVAA